MSTTQSGLVVLYLLYISRATTASTIPKSYYEAPGSPTKTHALAFLVLLFTSLLQTLLLIAYTTVLMAKVDSFGSSPECNRAAVLTLFLPCDLISADLGWIYGVAIVIGSTCLGYLIILAASNSASIKRSLRWVVRRNHRRKVPPPALEPIPIPNISGVVSSSHTRSFEPIIPQSEVNI